MNLIIDSSEEKRECRNLKNSFFGLKTFDWGEFAQKTRIVFGVFSVVNIKPGLFFTNVYRTNVFTEDMQFHVFRILFFDYIDSSRKWPQK